MGLFGPSKNDVLEAENAAIQKLAQVELLDRVVDSILEETEKSKWLVQGQSYYDNCNRIVNVTPDTLEIKWVSYHQEPYIGEDGKQHIRKVEDVIERVGYMNTKSGYLPLHSYRHNGFIEVPTEKICELWARLVRENLQAKLSGCFFDEVVKDNNGIRFVYHVPGVQLKDWF